MRLALTTLALLLPARAAALPLLRVSFSAGLSCPAPGAVLEALTARFGASRIALGQPTGTELGLSLAQAPAALELDLVGEPGDPPYHRRLPLDEGSCSELAETIALLVDAWLRDLPWHGAGFLPDVPAVEPVEAGSALATGQTAEVAVQPPFLRLAGLELRIGGGASLGSDATGLGAEATLSADLDFSHGLGLALFASLLQNASAADPLASSGGASISVSRQVFALAPRYAFFGREERGPRLFAGLALEAFEGHANGYSFDTSSTVFNPAGFLAFLWQERIWGRLSAYAQLSAILGPRLAFDVAGAAQPVLALPFGWFDLSAGLSVRLF